MAEHSLFPTSVALRYHNNFAPHVMTIPLNEWSPISSGHGAGTLKNWNDVQIDVIDFMDDFIDLLLPFFYTDSHFDNYTIYTYEDADAPARPQVDVGLTAKTGTGGTYIPATQANYMFRTGAFGYLKITMLDVVASAQFLPVSSFPSPAYDTTIALAAFVTNNVNAIRGRDQSKPQFLKKITYTLNEKLRRSYRLT
jgi:hypothetical protein